MPTIPIMAANVPQGLNQALAQDQASSWSLIVV